MRQIFKIIAAGALCLPLLWSASQAQALTLPDPLLNSVLYGDFQSYSLPLLAYQYDLLYGGGTGPGNPFYVNSTPGAIMDDIVVATGANGKPVTTNYAGMDNAYPTPNSSGTPTFSTGASTDPGPTFVGDQSQTWDARIAALTSFLAGDELIFLFNNNQENSGSAINQNLYAWGQVAIRDSAGVANPLYFDFTNSPVGGIFGGDPGTYTSPGAWNPEDMDYVLSGGQICLDGGGSVVDCGNASAVSTINHNLGANQAAYAVVSLELNDFLNSWTADSVYDVLSIDFRMKDLNSGFEQLFIQKGTIGGGITQVVPEPGTIVLLAGGLLGLGYVGRRRRQK